MKVLDTAVRQIRDAKLCHTHEKRWLHCSFKEENESTREIVGKSHIHFLYFLVIDNNLPIASSQTGLTAQTHIKVSSQDAFLNNVSIFLEVNSKNYRRTSKNLARFRTAMTQRKRKKE